VDDDAGDLLDGLGPGEGLHLPDRRAAGRNLQAGEVELTDVLAAEVVGDDLLDLVLGVVEGGVVRRFDDGEVGSCGHAVVLLDALVSECCVHWSSYALR
jgi:hypothetical protein